jgi:transposase
LSKVVHDFLIDKRFSWRYVKNGDAKTRNRLHIESPRVLRRLFSLRGLSHEQDNEESFHQKYENALYAWCSEHRGDYPSLWAAIESIAPKIGCGPQTLNEWVKRDEIDTGTRAGVTTADLQRLKELERENKELRKANEILKLASAFFAQAELDRRLKS